MSGGDVWHFGMLWYRSFLNNVVFEEYLREQSLCICLGLFDMGLICDSFGMTTETTSQCSENRLYQNLELVSDQLLSVFCWLTNTHLLML